MTIEMTLKRALEVIKFYAGDSYESHRYDPMAELDDAPDYSPGAIYSDHGKKARDFLKELMESDELL